MKNLKLISVFFAVGLVIGMVVIWIVDLFPRETQGYIYFILTILCGIAYFGILKYGGRYD